MQPYRKIRILSIAGVDSSDYPDMCDAYIEEAEWVDNGELLTDAELCVVNDDMDYAEAAQDMARENVLTGGC